WKLEFRPKDDELKRGDGSWQALRQVILTNARDPKTAYAKALRVDTTTPKTTATPVGKRREVSPQRTQPAPPSVARPGRATEDAAAGAKQKDERAWYAPVLVELKHDDHPLAPGGLLGRYYRQPDFSGEMLTRVDPFVSFWDERPQYRPMVIGAKSGRWEGALYEPATSKAELELAVWFGGPAKASFWIDGEEFLKYPDAKAGGPVHSKKECLLTKGLHAVRLDFADPQRATWSCMLFRWHKGKGYGDEARTEIGPDVLWHPQNVATTFYQLNDEPAKPYREPISLSEGVHTLRFHSEDEAGHVEAEQTLTLRVVAAPAPPPEPPTPQQKPSEAKGASETKEGSKAAK
ncbi:MAG: hypothetical protein FJ279_10190, partial [Planctomycetes bacterium]|nr:hypothetical protein [Planctomycetota bacterium]